MKKIILFFVFISFFQLLSAQTISDVGKITLSIAPIESDISEAQQSLLTKRIEQIITSEGISSFTYGNFTITPKVSLQNSEVIEGGMKNINVVWLDLSLIIQENTTGKIFSSYYSTLKGSAMGKDKAVIDAINKINNKSAELKKFISEGKKEIISYYKENCNSIIQKSEGFAQRKQYEEAIALLLSIPEELKECYSNAQKNALQIYNKYQEKNCKQQLQKVSALIANKNYEEALSILMNVDPSTSCYNEAKKQINIIENKIKAEDDKQWNFMMQQYKDKVSLEKYRINAIKEIAAAYYRQKASNNVYILR